MVAVVDSVEAQEVIALLVLAVHLKPQFPAELEHPVLPLAQPGPAGRHHGPVGKFTVPHPPARHVSNAAVGLPGQCSQTLA
ncbi:hypothetical protein SAMN05428945_4077 [Streptomyces sp. 2224.1]|nr:hypothetical protein BX261_1260 [Streptomyces sp. 2321.6]SDR55265.1 hypothetical protein SAMN05216511_5956 [Streptomyces sp. KS_16]SEC13037.1 hypothetical protein SAMN05428940_1259 [Streptomyces sp. 2133.1]SED17688.1 hypothetical protein SAMN05428945_4077 [Streptomyces sp. 2224.1]SEF08295.1 hypothetical protein SAMN05428954_6019 [Streptomyces sp. 2112.3]SNC65150.1 hypothetical protein SAMN06272741_1258 [Streptomyces sp. 2114.4]